MSVNAAIEGHSETLRRMAVRLLALAVLAERAAGRSMLVRAFVLWLLGRAEAPAWAFAAEAGTLPFTPSPTPLFAADAAARLAESFRALAAIFFALSRQSPRLARLRRGRKHRSDLLRQCRPNAEWPAGASVAHTPRAPPRHFILA